MTNINTKEIEPPGSTRLVRVLRLLNLLHTHGELATRELTVLLGADRKKIMRDLRVLRAAGVPVHWVGRGRNRRHKLASHYRQAPVQGDEALALAIGRTVLATGQLPWNDVTNVPVHRLTVLPDSPSNTDNRHIDSVITAAVFGRCVTLSQGGTSHVVAPYGVAVVSGATVVVGRTEDALWHAWRLPEFDVTASSERWELPTTDISIDEALVHALGSSRPPTAVLNVTVEVAAHVAELAREREWPETARWKQQPSGVWWVHSPLVVSQVVSHLLSFAGTFSVKAPEFLAPANRLADTGTTLFIK